ncbi:MAG: oligoribonuclease [Nitrospiraceae bacterium]|nr:MAG: oligoribonuclease [Nitrospiraceae bacterium]
MNDNSKTEKTTGRQSNLVWMDLEMSGLDPEQNTILEIATLITDFKLEVIAEGPVIAIHQTDELLDSMDEWNTNCHNETGLTERVRKSDIEMKDAEITTLDFIKEHVDQNRSPLCGNTIWQDRRFLIKYMPDLESFFHYRNIDVSSIKEICTRWYPDLPRFEKKKVHSAMKDIRESVEELKYYRVNIFLS